MAGTLYEDCLAAGVPVQSHESDLYIPVNETTRALLVKHGKTGALASTFTNQVEGGTWYDIPFAFDPYWAKVAEKDAK